MKQPDQAKLATIFESFLDELGFDWQSDDNMKDTPSRVSKMYSTEIFSGVYSERPDITVFPNTENYDQLIISKWNFSSTCSHHFLPFVGEMIIGVLPGKKLLGLSKYARIATWYADRPQLQENLTQQIANDLEELLQPRALGIYIKAQHMCASLRGVMQTDSYMITTAIQGEMRRNPSLKQEFMTSWK